MDPDTFLASLKAWGLTVVEHGDWRNFNRGQRGDGWGPVNGFLVHNTWSQTSDASMLNYLTTGDAEKPGPVVQMMMDKAGVIHLIGWGRANHAGRGDSQVLDRVARDDVPMNGELKPRSLTSGGDTDGNAHFVGVEMNYYLDPTPAQRAALPRLIAAFLKPLGWAATSCIAHREWTMTRSDPVGFKMGDLRTQVAALLSNNPQEDDMFSDADRATLNGVNTLLARLDEFKGQESNRYADYVRRFNSLQAAIDPSALADAVVAKLPADADITREDVKAALGEALAESVKVTGNLTVEPNPPAA